MNMMMITALAPLLLLALLSRTGEEQKRPRARDLGIRVGVLPTGRLNAMADVAGVGVGHATLIRGTDVRTGVTAIMPHPGNIFQQRVPAAVFVGNGFGKLMGTTQINELGELETPILLTNTLNVPRVADALLDWMLALPGNERVQSINPVVAETNDGFLNDIRGRHVGREEVFAALRFAAAAASSSNSSANIEEGSIGAGTGTVAFGYKGGIGTSSRLTPASLGGYTVGVLVQTNFGGVLTINGAPVGQELNKYYLRDRLKAAPSPGQARGGGGDGGITPGGLHEQADGSIIIVVATDAPLDARNLRRLAARAMMGLARTGSAASNGSGDYVIAFSTARQSRIGPGETVRQPQSLGNDAMSPLFLGVIEATEEAIYNSMLRATSVTGRDGRRVEALPVEQIVPILKKYGALSQK